MLNRNSTAILGAVLCASLMLVASPATSQSFYGSLVSVVQDAQGRVIPAATIVLTNTATSERREGVSADGICAASQEGGRHGCDGSYRLVDLVPGTYVVTAQLAGFATLVRENVVVREGLNLTLDLTMTVGAISETVEVRADTPLLESKTAAQGVNISGDLQRAPPLAALRTWADALTLVPGVTTSQARFQTYSLFGTAHLSGVALIDGADATSVLQGSTLYSQFGRDTFSDIQVKTGGVDASTPLGLGAVLTAASQTSAADTRRRALLSYREVV